MKTSFQKLFLLAVWRKSSAATCWSYGVEMSHCHHVFFVGLRAIDQPKYPEIEESHVGCACLICARNTKSSFEVPYE